MKLDEMLAREAIRYTIGRYNSAIDRSAYAELAEVFTPDGTMTFGGQASFEGRDKIIAALTRQSAQRTGEIEPADLAAQHHPEGVDAVRVSGDRLRGNSRCGRPRAGAEQNRSGIGHVGRQNALCPVVDRIEPANQLGAEWYQVGLGDHQQIGECGLPPSLGKTHKRLGAVHRVDQEDHRRETQAVIEHRVGPQREQDWRRVGEAGRLDDNPAKLADLAGVAPLDQAAQSARQVLAYRAAQAAAGQLEHVTFDKVDQMMIDRDLADLVDDDGCVRQPGRGQCPAQQCRLAAAQKACQQGRR